MVYCYGKAWIILICCLILAGIIAGFFDWRYIMVALIAVCFVIPLVMMFMYYDYGLRPYSYFNSVHHRLIFDETDILIEVYVKEYQDEQKEELWFGKKEDSWFGKKKDNWYGEKQEEVVEKEEYSVSCENKNSDSESSSKDSALIFRSTIKIPLVDVLPYYIYGDKLIVPLKTKPKGIIILPMDAWLAKEDFKNVVESLRINSASRSTPRGTGNGTREC